MQDVSLTPYPIRSPYGPVRPIDEELLQEICRRIVDALHPIRIVLFGSRARGDHRPDSDIDLMIEVETTERRLDRMSRVNLLFKDRWWAMDALVYTPEEIKAKRFSLISPVPAIEREGRVLYCRTDGS